MPCEEEEADTDPHVVEQGEVQQSSYAVKRVDRAESNDEHKYINPVCDIRKGTYCKTGQKINTRMIRNTRLTC